MIRPGKNNYLEEFIRIFPLTSSRYRHPFFQFFEPVQDNVDVSEKGYSVQHRHVSFSGTAIHI
jgi:hypothetical protein